MFSQPTNPLFGNQPSGGQNQANQFQPTTSQTQPTTSLFGQSAQPTTNIFGQRPGLFGQPVQQQQQPQQQQQMPLSSLIQPSGPIFTKSTKFNDLPQDMKRALENLDTSIQTHIQISKDLHQRKLGEEPTKGQELLRDVHKVYLNTASIIRDDFSTTKDMKQKVDQAVEDTIVATRLIDAFRNPQGGNTALKDHAGFPLEFFTRAMEQMRERLNWYKATIEQIERKLSSHSSQAQSPQGISATLQAQHATFLALASKTAALDAELQKITALYTQLWRAKTGSVRDPFIDLDQGVDVRSGDLGMSKLNFK